MRGILLAGGNATRLHPCTKTISKHLLPVYDKPMIHYPLSTLMLAGITEILIISTRRHTWQYEEALGDGHELGIKICYKEQMRPAGLPEAFLIGEDFIGDENVCLVLGDNIFYANNLTDLLEEGVRIVEAHLSGAHVWGYEVSDARRYGVLRFLEDNRFEVVEKPKDPPTNYAVPGIYFFDNTVAKMAKRLKPSARGELEIADLINTYSRRGFGSVDLIGRGMTWLDAGTFDSLLDAAQFVQTIQRRTGLRIGDIKETAQFMGYIQTSE